MTIRVALTTAALLAFGLFLAACAVETEPAATAEPTAAPASDQPPAASDQPPTPSPQPLPTAPFRDLGPAPEINNETWLNTDRPLPLSSLRGQVVLVEFWTFG
jgi:hypothetical protein